MAVLWIDARRSGKEGTEEGGCEQEKLAPVALLTLASRESLGSKRREDYFEREKGSEGQ